MNRRKADGGQARDADMLERIVERCGAAVLVTPEETALRALNLRGGRMAAVPLLRPATTEEVRFIVSQAREAGRALIPVGGATGLVNALRPATGDEWYLSLERMRRIERIDPVSRVAVVEAGVVLQSLHDAVAPHGLLFPVDLGARGSATIGGLVSTNAGGERVLRYGMMREQVLGLEVVTADGTVLDLMGEVLKNNAGYDLKQLFIGSEGTLGIVTRAVLRLRARPERRHAAFVGLSSLSQVPLVLARIEQGMPGALSAFELMWPEFIETMCGGVDAPHRLPVAAGAAGYLLVETEGRADDEERFHAVLETLLEDDMASDIAVAQSEAERAAFWAIRAEVGRIVKLWNPAISFDVSVPVAHMTDYAETLHAELKRRWSQARVMLFGHVADNNLHIVLTVGPETRELSKHVADVVYRGVVERRGSISAEHGIGLDKRDALAVRTPESVLALMRQMKRWMDPRDLLNPGKVI